VKTRWSGGPVRAAAAIALCAACAAPLPPEEPVTIPHEGTVVVYVEAPRSRAGPILASFAEQTGIEVQATYLEVLGDAFFERLKNEAGAGRVDLFWGDSPLAAMELDDAGLAATFRPAGVPAIPTQYRHPRFHWAGFAVNPRVIIYNNRQVSPEEAPQYVWDLIRPPWGGRAAVTRIQRGPAAFHAAVLLAAWGAERGRTFYDNILKNGNQIVADEDTVLRRVVEGKALWGIIDFDRAICAKRFAKPVHLRYPDLRGLGMVVVPNVAVLLRGAPHPAQAKGLYAYLFSTETAWMLGQHDCALLTLLPGIARPAWVPTIGTLNVKRVDNEDVYRAYRENSEFFATWGNSGRDTSPPAEPAAPASRPMVDAVTAR
jgi:iron(III) transport system substrate-binding protein